MTLRRSACAAVLLLLAALPLRAAAKPYAIKVVDRTPPKELAEPVRKLLDARCVQFLDGKGEVLSELWFRKDVPAKAAGAQGKDGLTYREVPQTTLLGAMRVARSLSDYRKQKIAAGVYTLRLAFQPMDGDHMGTAPYSSFCLVSQAAEDRKPDTIKPSTLNELSAKATDSHPGVFLLFPGKGATAQPQLVSKEGGHWVLLYQLSAQAGGKKAVLPIGLTLIGTSTAA